MDDLKRLTLILGAFAVACGDSSAADGAGDATLGSSTGRPMTADGSGGSASVGTVTVTSTGIGDGSDGSTTIDPGTDTTVTTTSGSTSGSSGSSSSSSGGGLFCPESGPPGTEVWTGTLDADSPSFNDIALDIVGDGAGGAIVVGYKSVLGQGHNIWIALYDVDGNEVWSQTPGGVGFDEAYAVDLAPNGDIVVAGLEAGAPLLRAYDLAGSEQWTTAALTGTPTGLDVDAAGTIFVVGDHQVAGESLNGWVARHTSTGDEQWSVSHNGPAGGDDLIRAVVVVEGEGVAVAGSESVVGEGRNGWVALVDPTDGQSIWADSYNGANNQDDDFRGVAADGDGNVVVAGTSNDGNGRDIRIVQYSAAGALLWSDAHDGPISSDDDGHDVAIDAENSVYLVGAERDINTGTNLWARKYSPAGAEQWTYVSDGMAPGFDLIFGAAVGACGRALVAGAQNQGNGGFSQIWFGALNP